MAKMGLSVYRPRRIHAAGLLAVFVGSIVCMGLDSWLAGRVIGLSALTLAIIIGIIIGNTVYKRMATPLHDGVNFAKGQVLRTAIVLYGFKLTFAQVESVGMPAILTDALMLTLTFSFAYWVGIRWLKMDKQTTLLIGAGASICGAAAVIATEPVVKAQAHKVTIAVATVVVFGTLGMLLYPILYRMGWLQPWLGGADYGVYIGSSVHEVAQVVAAGNAISPEAGSVAVITKMIRVMMLAPFLLILSFILTPVLPDAQTHPQGGSALRQRLRHVRIPWFAFAFIGVVVLHSMIRWPMDFIKVMVMVDNLLLTMAMFALGLTTHINAVKQAGIKPLILGASIFLWLVLGGAAINILIRWFF